MSVPRRYRLALFALPREARERLRDDILLTLGDTDRDRDGPSLAEAAAIIKLGIGLRVRCQTPQRLLWGSTVLLLAAVAAPGGAWGTRMLGDGVPKISGPSPLARMALVAALSAVFGLLIRPRRASVALAAGSCLIGELVLRFAAHANAPADGPGGVLSGRWAPGALGLAAAAGALAWLGVRASRRSRLVLAAGALLAAAGPAIVGAAGPPHGANGPLPWLMPWELGPAGLLASAAVVIAAIALSLGVRRPRPAVTGAG